MRRIISLIKKRYLKKQDERKIKYIKYLFVTSLYTKYDLSCMKLYQVSKNVIHLIIYI